MHGRVRLPALMALLARLVIGAFGQDSAPANSAMAGIIPSFQGVPYSADQFIERVRTLADGTQVTELSQKSRIYRDSAGRTRIERSQMASKDVSITIVDPVAHVSYSLDAADKIARKRAIHTRQDRPPLAPGTTRGATAVADEARPQTTVEKLGDKTIEGVLVTGTRRTTTWPVGSRRNDQPVTVISEVWVSRDLRLMVLSELHDPFMGNITQKLIHIQRTEPDPKLFQPPTDYAITDEPVARHVAGMRAAPVSASMTSAALPPEPGKVPELEPLRPEPAAQPEPAPGEASTIDESPVESSFDDAPLADIPADTDSPAQYVGVNAVYVGVSRATPAAPKAPAATNASKKAAPAPPKQPNPKKPIIPKTPSPEKPVQ
jgi:hypothetical protein